MTHLEAFLHEEVVGGGLLLHELTARLPLPTVQRLPTSRRTLRRRPSQRRRRLLVEQTLTTRRITSEEAVDA